MEAQKKPFLRFREYSVYYGSYQAVKDFDIEIDGGVIGLLGPNGAGKTTLIKGILGLQPKTRGDIEVYSRNTRDKSMRRIIGYMAEDDTLITGVNGINFTAYMGLLAGMPRVEAIKRAHEVIGYIGLGEIRYRNVDTYSKGNIQRIKLAAALVHDPDCLFLDEPTAGLDPKGHAEMLELIREFGRLGKDIVISSHLIDEIEKICDKIVLIQDGSLRRFEKIKKLKKKDNIIFETRIYGDNSVFEEIISLLEGINIIRKNNSNFIISVEETENKRLLFEKCLEKGVEIRLFVPSEHKLQDVIMDIIDNER